MTDEEKKKLLVRLTTACVADSPALDRANELIELVQEAVGHDLGPPAPVEELAKKDPRCIDDYVRAFEYGRRNSSADEHSSDAGIAAVLNLRDAVITRRFTSEEAVAANDQWGIAGLAKVRDYVFSFDDKNTIEDLYQYARSTPYQETAEAWAKYIMHCIGLKWRPGILQTPGRDMTVPDQMLKVVNVIFSSIAATIAMMPTMPRAEHMYHQEIDRSRYFGDSDSLQEGMMMGAQNERAAILKRIAEDFGHAPREACAVCGKKNGEHETACYDHMRKDARTQLRRERDEANKLYNELSTSMQAIHKMLDEDNTPGCGAEERVRSVVNTLKQLRRDQVAAVKRAKHLEEVVGPHFVTGPKILSEPPKHIKELAYRGITDISVLAFYVCQLVDELRMKELSRDPYLAAAVDVKEGD